MVYSKQFVVAIKLNGQILRESSNQVTLPFGSEYSILLKNLNSVKSSVTVSVDGQEATGEISLVVPANESVELERFIRNGNMEAGNRFKFVKRSKGVEAHRGIKVDDGLIRVEYTFEQRQPEVVEEIIKRRVEPYYPPFDPYYPYPHPWYPRPWYPLPRLGGSNLYKSSTGGFQDPDAMDSIISSSATKGSSVARSVSLNNVTQAGDNPGITVPGSESNQRFVHVPSFKKESQSHVIVLHLVGQVGKLAVVKAITVKHKPTCNTCGKVNLPNNKFCSDCGTALLLL
jgi:hypothetical protein